jgi:hypothetical protein
VDYNDVKGSLLRYWKVTTPNGDVGLDSGDVLMFDGESLGTITKLKPRTNPRDKRNTAVKKWATSFTAAVIPTPGYQYTINGKYQVSLGASKQIRIDFNEQGSQGASHQGTFDPSSTSSTWMADEGP